MLIKYEDGSTVRGIFADEGRHVRIPHGFHRVFCEFYYPQFEHRNYFHDLVVCAPDDFGTLTPVYLPAVLNLKREGH